MSARKNYSLLKKLTQIIAVSNQVDQAFVWLQKSFPQTFTLTANHNLYFGPPNPDRVVVAHFDEVGFQVTAVTATGYLKIKGIGWIKPELLAGQSVQIVSAKQKIHDGLVLYHDVLSIKKINRWSDIFVDLGFTDRVSVGQQQIKVGCPGTYKKTYWETLNKIFASALDNRLGVYLLLELIRQQKRLLFSKNIGLLLTSDEEESNIRAQRDLKKLQPGEVIALDILPHNLGMKKLFNLNQAPWVVARTNDYRLPPPVHARLKRLGNFYKLSSTNKYLNKSEPYKFQRSGIKLAWNLIVPVANYHHNIYSVNKKVINLTYDFLIKYLKNY